MSERERSVTLNKGPAVPLWLPAGPEKGKEQKREEQAWEWLFPPFRLLAAGLFVGTHALTSGEET